MKKTIILLLIISLTMIITSCNKDLDEPIGIRGVIKEIHRDEEGSLIQDLLVEGEVEEDTMYDVASVTINNDTKIYKGEEKASFDDLEEEVTIEVIFDGPVAESYPVQGTAKKINILED